MELMPVVKGLATHVPFLYRATRGTTGGSVSARYCYAVWMRHLVQMRAAGMNDNPRTVAELGPGDSLGIGLAALLTGAANLVALDVVHYANLGRNHAVLDALVDLLGRRTRIPDAAEFEGIFPPLPSHEFPDHILTAERLERALQPERVAAIHRSLDTQTPQDGVSVRYVVPWEEGGVVEAETIDLILSQAVLEHVVDLQKTYAACAQWLRAGGVMSHVIDFRSHRMTRNWDGHRQYPAWLWRVVHGARPYLLNRRPLSAHLAYLASSGFVVASVERDVREPTVERAALPREFRGDTETDRSTASAAIVARRAAAGVEVAGNELQGQ